MAHVSAWAPLLASVVMNRASARTARGGLLIMALHLKGGTRTGNRIRPLGAAGNRKQGRLGFIAETTHRITSFHQQIQSSVVQPALTGGVDGLLRSAWAVLRFKLGFYFWPLRGSHQLAHQSFMLRLRHQVLPALLFGGLGHLWECRAGGARRPSRSGVQPCPKSPVRYPPHAGWPAASRVAG